MMYISGCKRASSDQLSVAQCRKPEEGKKRASGKVRGNGNGREGYDRK